MFEAGFLEREVIYLCGLRQKNTYARHYCDYTNPLLQSYLHAKLSRWECTLQCEAQIPVTRQQVELKDVEEFLVSGFENAEFEMSFGLLNGKSKEVIIAVESQNGVDLNATIIVHNKSTQAPAPVSDPEIGDNSDRSDALQCVS